MTRRLKRNDVVLPVTGGLYARVVRRLDDDHVEVVTCGRHIRKLRDDELELHADYKGRWDTYGTVRSRFPIWRAMPTLRRLKQGAAYYNIHAWARHRGGVDLHAEDYWDTGFEGGRKDQQEARWRRDYPQEAARYDAEMAAWRKARGFDAE